MPRRRRPNGALEREVLACLWTAGHPLTAGDVNEALGADLAPTTVMTVLSRLDAKGLARRVPTADRPHRYEPTISEEDLTARRMMEVLGTTDDRVAVLSRFLGSLREDDRDALRAALWRPPPT